MQVVSEPFVASVLLLLDDKGEVGGVAIFILMAQAWESDAASLLGTCLWGQQRKERGSTRQS